MAEEKNSGPTAKKKRTPAKKKPARKRAVKKSAAPAVAAPAATGQASAEAAGDRLTEVAKTIGSTVGDIVAKTKRVLKRK